MAVFMCELTLDGMNLSSSFFVNVRDKACGFMLHCLLFTTYTLYPST